MSQFSLTWEAHNKNICRGLTALQQNGELVDMTLAADGHHVKVHQLVLSLASPYFKEIITSLPSTHPVIFLTKIPYHILSAILEYIYTGEVLIEKDSINDLIEAAKELKIQGLEEMTLNLSEQETITKPTVTKLSHGQPLSDYKYDEKSNENEIETSEQYDFPESMETDTEQDETKATNITTDDNVTDANQVEIEEINQKNVKKDKVNKQTDKVPEPRLQYTVSNMGALQMILNRCIYFLRYTSVKGSEGHRHWRCTEYFKRKCPAGVISQGNFILKRYGAHNHPFHDRRILRKVRDGLVYAKLQDAESSCKFKPK